ncbi:hypothetical protein SAMN05216365_12613 [Porphyromonadaceae bacterium NLAE-zl-C104]|nr:hypothetical protein SAMN05216365_12613 [Porphyromonadaceae bacterium NLAE-zl-C104]
MVLSCFIPCHIFASLNKAKSKKIMETTDFYLGNLLYSNTCIKISLLIKRMCC